MHLYANCLICIFMNINENIRNERKIIEKLRCLSVLFWFIYCLMYFPLFEGFLACLCFVMYYFVSILVLSWLLCF